MEARNEVRAGFYERSEARNVTGEARNEREAARNEGGASFDAPSRARNEAGRDFDALAGPFDDDGEADLRPFEQRADVEAVGAHRRKST